MEEKDKLQIFLAGKRIGVKIPTKNFFVSEQIKQIPFSSFDYKTFSWKIPIWELPTLLDILHINERQIPQNIIDLYKDYLEEERKTVHVYLNKVNGLLSLSCRNDAVRHVQYIVKKCTNRDGSLKCEYYKFVDVVKKFKDVKVRATKEAGYALEPEKFAEKIAPKLQALFPGYPELNAKVVDVSYVEKQAYCEICGRAASRLILIKNLNTGRIVSVCELCANMIIPLKTYMKYKKKLDALALRADVHKASPHMSLWKKLFRAKAPLVERGRIRNRRDLRNIKQVVAETLEKNERNIANSQGKKEEKKDENGKQTKK